MKDKYQSYKLKYESLVVRERLLLLGALLAAIYFIWEIVFYSPLAEKKEVMVARERVATQQINSTQAQLEVFKMLAGRDPNGDLKVELEKLKSKLLRLDNNLAELAKGLVPADKLPDLLHDLVLKANEVELLEIKTLPVSEVRLSEVSEARASEPAPNPGLNVTANSPVAQKKIFKHGVHLRLAGSYTSLYEYLVRVEGSSWQLYWETLKYEVTAYPGAHLELKVYTLSSEQGIFNG